jgi:hypothetical protein
LPILAQYALYNVEFLIPHYMGNMPDVISFLLHICIIVSVMLIEKRFKYWFIGFIPYYYLVYNYNFGAFEGGVIPGLNDLSRSFYPFVILIFEFIILVIIKIIKFFVYKNNK